MKKLILSLLITVILLSSTVMAASFYFDFKHPGQTLTSSAVKKSVSGPGWIYPSRHKYFDLNTDTVYFRVRRNGNYATNVVQLGVSAPFNKGTYLSYHHQPGVTGRYYVLYSNMYTSVPGGYLTVWGYWRP